jgi:hypothetical protein
MARARNIKPGFFKNELLCELAPMDRLLFAGLWCLADREGRLENRPKKIKMELFPCDDYDVAKGLSNLESGGFIKTYHVEHFNVIQVLSFLFHQVPHGTEKDSELPDYNGVLTVNQRKDNGYVTGNHWRVTVDQLLSNGVLTVKQLSINTLNPESLILNPDIPPNPQKGNGGRRSKNDQTPYQDICEAYRKALPDMAQPDDAKTWNKTRKSCVKARWDEDEKRQSVDWWNRYFGYVAKSAFLTGKTPEGFEATFDWLVKPTNLQKVIEGNYHKVVKHGTTQ